MNKFKSVLLCILLIISCCLPANSYANGIDIINKILNTQQNEVNGMDLINKALNGNDYQEVKMIYSKQQVVQEIKKSKSNPIPGNDRSYILGVDISKWNSNIDWKAVKKANIDFVIIRAG